MKRFPNGVDKQAFYQQRHPEAVPPGVRRQVLPAQVEPITEEGPRDRLIGGSLTTLLYMTQLAAISQDPWFSRVADPLHPDHVAIDLDPGDEATFANVLDVARWVKDEIDRLGIPGVPKTSGASGLHIYVPLPKGTTYDTGQVLCQIIATIVATKHPKIATVERMVRKRPRGTVYVDYLQTFWGRRSPPPTRPGPATTQGSRRPSRGRKSRRASTHMTSPFARRRRGSGRSRRSVGEAQDGQTGGLESGVEEVRSGMTTLLNAEPLQT
jgi:bifunctional non-homologous end joining protein LigD